MSIFYLVPPIRSCREYMERCHRKRDGIYRLTVVNDEENESYNTYCDMTRNEGGWTLVLTSKNAGDWTAESILGRQDENPSLQNDFSILRRADDITSIVEDADFDYRLEAGEPGEFGGIWRAPAGYK